MPPTHWNTMTEANNAITLIPHPMNVMMFSARAFAADNGTEWTSIKSAKLVKCVHWQPVWVALVHSTRHPSVDQTLDKNELSLS